MIKRQGPGFERKWQGIPLFGYGFRPFFLGGTVFGGVAVLIWILEWSGATAIVRQMDALDWHIHEMVFGYPAAVIAGFLFTAVPNWTRRMPISGRPLVGFFALWLAGRGAMLAPAAVPYAAAATMEALFLPALAAMIAREIIAGRNWRNLKVLVPVTVLGLANLWFHLEVAGIAPTESAPLFGLAAVLFLVTLIGGRIIPSFTRNWLAQQPEGPLPAPFGRFDAAVTAATVAALVLWVAAPALGAFALLPVALGQLVRLARWAGLRTLSNPLLFVLHLFYFCIPAGLGLLAWAELAADPALRVAALHVLGIGGIAGMTLAVMARASLGHTGRALQSDPALNLVFALVPAAMLFRILAALAPQLGWALHLSVALWLLAFALFAFRVGPWLLTRRPVKAG